MVKSRNHYCNGLTAAVAERAETIGLCRDVTGFYEYVGYLEIVNDDETKRLYEITLKADNGLLGNAITKSENVIRQINDIIETVGDAPRSAWKIGFSETKTKNGNNVIIVNMTLGDPEQVPVIEKAE